MSTEDGALLQRVLDGLSEAVLVVRPDGRTEVANAAARDTLRCLREGRDLTLVLPECAPLLEAAAATRTEQVAMVAHADGGAPLHVRVRPLGGEGDPDLLLCTLARSGAADAEGTQARHQALLGALPDMLFVLDADARYLACHGDEEPLLVAPHQLLGQRAVDVLPPPVGAEATAATRAAIATGEPQVFEYTLQMDGRDRAYEARILPIAPVHADGPPQEALAIVRDVTEARAMARSLVEARERSEEFVAHVSHELRTPMASVIGLAELLAETELDPEQSEFLDGIRWSGRAMLELIGEVLDLAKLEARDEDAERVPVALRPLLAGTVRGLAARAFQKGVELVLRVEPEVPERITSDGGRIRQIVVNLVANAIRFTKRGEVVVRAAMEVDPPTLVVSVRDTGIGIPKDQQALIFEAYQQGRSADPMGGTGLGLSIAQRLVSSLGGEIEVESEVDVGSVFTFRVPALDPTPAPTPPLELSGRRILLVWDNATLGGVIGEMVSAWGSASVHVDNMADAIDTLRTAIFQGAPHDLAIVDANLLGLDLPLLMARGEAQPTGPPLPIVLATSPLRSGRHRAAGQGGIEQVRRPLDEASVAGAVLRLLGLREPSPAGGEARQTLPSGYSILVADDSPVNRLVIVRTLSREGQEVLSASDGPDAIALFERSRPEIAIIDLNMPGLSGIDVARRIRQIESEEGGAPALLVVLTARASHADRDRAFAAGFDAYLTKPLQPSKLVGTLVDLLASR